MVKRKEVGAGIAIASSRKPRTSHFRMRLLPGQCLAFRRTPKS